MSAILNLSIIPKRMMTQREAAEHCGRPLKRFKVECPVSPVAFSNGDLRYDVHDLDGWLDSLKHKEENVEQIIDRLGTR